MRFLLDESAEARIAVFLAKAGHDAARIGRDHPAGLSDGDVLDIAHRERRVLVANDKDFGELVVRFGRPHAGIVLFRCPLDATADEKIEALRRRLASDLPYWERLVVLSSHGIRAR